VTRLFIDLVTKDLLESAERGEWPAALWQAIEENGLTLPLVAESKGGAGGTWGDAFVVSRAAGRHAVPLPLAETIVGSWLLSGAGLDVPTGPLTIAPARRDDSPRLAPARAGGGGRARAPARRAGGGRGAARRVVFGAEGEGERMVARAGRGAAVPRDQTLAREPRDTVVFDGS